MRTLHLIDIENLAGPDPANFAGALTAYRHQYVKDGDHAVIGASSSNGGFHAGLAWRSARLVVRHGADGADLALLEVVDEVASRPFCSYDRVCIGSGDHIFAPAVSRLRHRGIAVRVVIGRGACSRVYSTEPRFVLSLPVAFATAA